MIPSPPINDHYQTCFGWLAARRSRARIHPLNSRTTALAIIRAINSALICTSLFILPKAKKYLSTRATLTSSAPPTCRNLHSLFAAPLSCGAAFPLPPDAISCLGAFPPPAGGPCGEISAAGVRKPAQHRTFALSFSAICRAASLDR
jgi:hypothetical protein